MTKQMKYRNICFTDFDVSDDKIEHLMKNTTIDPRVKYLVFQLEETQTEKLHIQGYLELNEQVAMSTVKKLLTNEKNSGIHIENRKGSAQEAANYCKDPIKRYSETEFFEFGNISQQGKRTDLSEMAKIVKEKGLKAAINDNPEKYILYNRGLKELDFFYNSNKAKKAPIVEWWYGSTGCGKTFSAMSSETPENIWISNKNLEWFDGYTNQKLAVIDDFRKDFCSFHELLRILDRYPYNAAIKGGFVYWNPERIIITSRASPEEIFANTPQEDINQLLRRIHKIRQYSIIDGKKCFKTIKDEKPSLMPPSINEIK